MTEPTNGPNRAIETIEVPPALKRFVADLADIQLMSLGAVDLMRELNREDISGREIAAKVGHDPTLSARILRLANSSYYGTTHKIATVNQAVTMLGVENVRHLIKGLCMVEMSTPKGGLAKVFGGKAFAAHAMAVSYLAGCLCKRFGFQMVGRGEAETAGLLHDIGICLIGSGDRNRYQKVQIEFWARMEDLLRTPEGLTLVSVEEEVLGFNHAQLGGWLAGEWNLPLHIREALNYHHGSIEGCVNREMVTVVQIAEWLSNDEELDYLPRGACGSLHPTAIAFLESQGKAQMLESLDTTMAPDLKKAQELYRLILQESAPSTPAGSSLAELEERVKKEPVPPAPALSPVPLPEVHLPAWSFLVPGLPHLMRDDRLLGGIYLGGFLISVLLLAFTAISGAPAYICGAFLLVAAACWLLSAVTG